MNFYEVFLKLIANGKDIGKTCIQVKADSPFTAAIKAEDVAEHQYSVLITQTLRVAEITEDEFLYCMAA